MRSYVSPSSIFHSISLQRGSILPSSVCSVVGLADLADCQPRSPAEVEYLPCLLGLVGLAGLAAPIDCCVVLQR
eukprot:2849216-Pyramimonas_sp.AAC.1